MTTSSAHVVGPHGRADAAALGDPSSRGGAVALVKAARKAGGWFTWSTVGTVTKPVKTVAAKDSGDGKAVFVDRDHERVLVKGIALDGRRFVVQYVEGKQETAYVLDTRHRAETDDGEVVEWETRRPTWRPATVSEVKRYLTTPAHWSAGPSARPAET